MAQLIKLTIFTGEINNDGPKYTYINPEFIITMKDVNEDDRMMRNTEIVLSCGKINVWEMPDNIVQAIELGGVEGNKLLDELYDRKYKDNY